MMTKQAEEQLRRIEREIGETLEDHTGKKTGFLPEGYRLNEAGELIVLFLDNFEIEKLDFLTPCTQLQVLILTRNQISDLSPLSNLTSLQTLELNQNKISDINPLSALISLQQLYLFENQISDISPLTPLACLKELDLSENLIADISPLSALTSLQELVLAENQILDIDPLSALTFLRELDLAENQISDISPLTSFDCLEAINLADNTILQLPFNFTQQSLTYVFKDNFFLHIGECNLYNNKITEPPLEVVKQGREAVIRYWERSKAEGTSTLYETKLTLAGEGGVGKTSLACRLVDTNTPLPSEEERTRGIAITTWEFGKKGRDKYLAHIWDFGGQDVYFPVHRFFLTQDAVFVLLGSTRHQSNNFEYWIETISHFGKQSPIILAQSCHNGMSAEWTGLDHYYGHQDFHIIQNQQPPYYALNLPHQNEGLEDIKKIIIQQLEALPTFGKKIYKSFIKLRKALAKLAEKKDKKVMSFAEFRTLHQEHSKLATPEDIRTDADLLHKLGIVLWFKDIEVLKDAVVYEPTWVLDAVYHILDDEKVKDQQGIVSPEDFSRIWQDQSYADHQLLLKSMLKAFKIGFEMKHKSGHYMIPALQPTIAEEDFATKYETEAKAQELIVSFKFMPKGIVNQLSSDKSSLIYENAVWKNAVIFHRDNTFCYVWEDERNRCLKVRLEGATQSEVFTLIKYSIEEIVKEYGVEKEVIKLKCPCPKQNCIHKEDQYASLDSLKRYYRERGQGAEWRCNEGQQDFPIVDLLYDIGMGASLKEIDQHRDKDNGNHPTFAKALGGLTKEMKQGFQKASKERQNIQTGVDHILDRTEELMALVQYNSEELKEAIEDLTGKQSKALAADMALILKDAFEHYGAQQHQELITACLEEINTTNDIETKLKIGLPLTQLLGIGIETEIKLNGVATTLQEKHPKAMEVLSKFISGLPY